MTDTIEPRAWIFHGVIPYGVVIVCERTLETACECAGIKIEKTCEWPAGLDIRKFPYEYQELQCGDKEEWSE